jgi:glycosyltransferase involved in cell wall biosynthesis
MNKVLIVTYYWPPSGGAGVQRWLKFAKYLPEFGWEPIILTVDPQYASYPVTDYSLNEDLSPDLQVYKTPATDYFSIYKKDKSKIPSAGFANSVDDTLIGKLMRFIRGNFFLPDPRKGWNKYAFKKASGLIETEGIKHVITTSPPHSTQLIGLKIKKKYPEIRWIADLRDPWTDIYYYKQFYPTVLSKMIDENYEKRVLEKADKITTVGSSLKNTFSLKKEGLESKTEVITNGYDEDDFTGIESEKPSKLTITYVGTLSDIYPVNGLVIALKKMKKQGMDFALRFVGSVSGKTKQLITSYIPDTTLEFLPYAIHSEAVKYLMSSTLLLLIIPSHQSNKSILTGKLFEYIASGKPILCLGPADGDAAEIIRKCKSGVTFDYNDSDKIFEFLSQINLYSEFPDKKAVKNFSRYNLARQMADALTSERTDDQKQ